MKHRIATQVQAWDSSAAGTRVLDLNMITPISRITVQMKSTNTDSTPEGHPAKMVSKLEVVDGSDVLLSMSGIECQALNYYDRGVMPHNVVNYVATAQSIATFHLDFGRHLWDEALALDPKRFKNLQLKITYDDDDGGCSSTASTISVFAWLFDEESITPRGFLMSKEQYTYTKVAAAHEYIELPTDYTIRKLIIQSLYSAKQPWEQYNTLKLSEDNDRRVVINNLRTSDLLKLYQPDRRIDEVLMVCDMDGAVLTYICPTYDTVLVGMGMNANDASLFATQSYGGTTTITGDTDELQQYIISGLAPHGALCIPFGEQDKIEDWYEVAPIKSLLLDVTAGAGAVGTIEIVTQQFRTY